jgi:hypothetical protein
MLMFTADARDRMGNQVFRPPTGWVRSAMSDTTILSPSAEKPNFVVILLRERKLDGDFRVAFDRNVVAALNGNLRVVRTTPVQSGRTPDGFNLLSTSVELRNPNGVPSLRIPCCSRQREFRIAGLCEHQPATGSAVLARASAIRGRVVVW